MKKWTSLYVFFKSTFKGHTLYSVPGAGPGPGPSEKADPIPKFTVWVKDSYLTNLRVLISNMTKDF